MSTEEKLIILADGAKYDASCSSSGITRKNTGGIGNGAYSGICHSFSKDGRCISLLKILFTNCCIFDCKYCINRKSNQIKRAIFTPKEICEITIHFYRRNYIEGLFLSSAVIKNADYTMGKLIETITLLRTKYHFSGYIHVKAIPGASEVLIKKLGSLVDRMSINRELPSDQGLLLLAPQKNAQRIEHVMDLIDQNKNKNFVPAGQSTQMIVGATKESDYEMMKKSSRMYEKYHLKRVFYSAYISVNQDKLLPSLELPPLKREHRLYEADFLLRFYGLQVENLLDKNHPNFNVLYDPKVDWALRHMNEFPKEINKASYLDLLKIPGIGPTSAKKIISSRKYFKITFEDLKKMGISIKRAKYFILCNGLSFVNPKMLKKDFIAQNIILESKEVSEEKKGVQLSLFYEGE